MNCRFASCPKRDLNTAFLYDMVCGMVKAKTVSEITKYIKQILDSDTLLKNIAVKGELSNFKRYPSGHCYFTLKDEESAIKGVMFKSSAMTLKFAPQNGMAVIITGRIGIYERDGVYQLYANSMEPEGMGALAMAFEQLKAKLAAEGLFDSRRKQKLPFFPKTIGVVTSIAGAVLRDINRVAKRRNRSVSIALYPVAVQGVEAAPQIKKAIEFFNREYKTDVLIVGRGGGSAEDLWAFNEETVVRAIAESKIPIISAVGHETDFTLADFAADVRAATPSQAAELAVPDREELARRVLQLSLRLRDNFRHELERRQNRLERCALAAPHELLADRLQILDSLTERLQVANRDSVRDKTHRFEVALNKLDALNPAAVMRRGFAAVQKNGKTVASAKKIAAGDMLDVLLSDGKIRAQAREILTSGGI